MADRFFRRWFAVVNLSIIAFVVLRAVSVWGALDGYGVNPWIFLLLDIITVPPYTWGISQIIRYINGKASVARLVGGGVSATLGFIIPYAYTYWAGYDTIPRTTKLLIAIVIVMLFVAGPVRKIINRKQKDSQVR